MNAASVNRAKELLVKREELKNKIKEIENDLKPIDNELRGMTQTEGVFTILMEDSRIFKVAISEYEQETVKKDDIQKFAPRLWTTIKARFLKITNVKKLDIREVNEMV